jgi:hypothetical protein
MVMVYVPAGVFGEVWRLSREEKVGRPLELLKACVVTSGNPLAVRFTSCEFPLVKVTRKSK